MTIDVRGVNTHNKGAHLMMHAIADRLGDHFVLSVSPNGSEYEQRGRLGFRQTLLLNQAPSMSKAIGNLIPASIRGAFGMVAEKEISGVLDAAGFAYSDSFPVDRARREAFLAAGWERRSVPIVFLPQAFGPFEFAAQRKWSSELLSRASAVYARDRRSLDYASGLGLRRSVRLAPDITIGLSADGIPRQVSGDYGAIVPNQKLVTHGGADVSEYISSLVSAGEQFRAYGVEPLVVIHEFNDLAIGREVAEVLDCDVFLNDDPLILKRVLGDAVVAIGSRFHAIVGALSQGTPVVAYGWSHKYVELLTDFGVPDLAADGPARIAALLDRALTAEALRQRILDEAARLRRLVDEMWVEVIDVLE